jgi:hypothetical protein
MVKFLDPNRARFQATFVKGPREEVITIGFDEKKKKITVKQVSKYEEMLQLTKKLTLDCPKNKKDEFAECVTGGLFDDHIKLADSKSRVVKFRDLISNRLRNYTCADEKMETSPSEKSYEWTHDSKKHTVEVLLDSDAAKIWYVNNFITDDECNHLMDYGRPLLRRATVASEDGSSVVSENRKAQQAGYSLKKDDKLLPLYQRVLALTNKHAGYKLSREGQEEFTIIQYNIDDQYTPHCDGQCEGQMYNKGGRVATAVLYCKVAERGGATTFTRSDIFVKPTVGSATFFSYRGSDGRMDDGYTEHSGCPVLEGEKWITTAWMRDGLSLDEPWSLFDPSGVRLLDSDYYDAQGKAHHLNDAKTSDDEYDEGSDEVVEETEDDEL